MNSNETIAGSFAADSKGNTFKTVEYSSLAASIVEVVKNLVSRFDNQEIKTQKLLDEQKKIYLISDTSFVSYFEHFTESIFQVHSEVQVAFNSHTHKSGFF